MLTWWSQLYYQYRYPACYRDTQFIESCGREGGNAPNKAKKKLYEQALTKEKPFVFLSHPF